MASRCVWAVGIPHSGKTVAAFREALADVNESGRPLLVIDAEGVCSGNAADGIPALPAITKEEAIRQIYTSGESARVVPHDEEDVAWICRALIGGRNAILLIDEASYYTRGAGILPDLARLLRIRRHVNVSIYATTQYVGDLAPLALQCATDIFAFRNVSQRALERLSMEYNLDPDALQNLQVGQCLRWSAWGPTGPALPQLPV